MNKDKLDAVRMRWSLLCGACDGGLPQSCTHPAEDPRGVILQLCDALAKVTAERDEVRRDLRALEASDDAIRAALEGQLAIARERAEQAQAALELLGDAWVVIANADGWNWDTDADLKWRAAAEKWRDNWHAFAGGKAAAPQADVEPKPTTLPVCADCGHRHRWGGECAQHSWRDDCGYDAGADCGWSEALPAPLPPAYNLPPKHCGELRVHAPHVEDGTICDGRTLPAAAPDPAACVADDPDHAGMTCDHHGGRS